MYQPEHDSKLLSQDGCIVWIQFQLGKNRILSVLKILNPGYIVSSYVIFLISFLFRSV